MSTAPTSLQQPCLNNWLSGRPVVSAPLLYRLERLALFLRDGGQCSDRETELAFGVDPMRCDPDPWGTITKSMAAALDELADGLLKQTVDLALVHQALSLQQGDGEGKQLHGPG